MRRFEEWAATAARAAGHDRCSEEALAIRLAPPDWLTEVFRQWGPLDWSDLCEVALIDRERLLPGVLQHVRQFIPVVLHDARVCGVEARARIVPGRDLTVRLRVDWGAGRWDPPNEDLYASGSDVDLLVWLADGVQEVTMERDQQDCHVWPVCPAHQLGTHAQTTAGTPVWWCRGGGHALARIGQL